MKIRFANILNEEKSPRQQKFIDLIVAEMKKYYENRYEGTHWVDATHGMSLDGIEKYRIAVDNVKEYGKQLLEIDERLQKVDAVSPSGLRDVITKRIEINEKYKNAMYTVSHLADIFNRSEWDKPNFIETYAVPVGILLDAWEQFFHEVYTPGKVEHNKTKSGIELEYGLPSGNYSEPKFYDSMFGSNKYFIMKDNEYGDFILGVDVDWRWKDSGVNYDDLYYKRFSSKDEMMQALIMKEKSNFRSELTGGSVELNSSEVDEVTRHLDREPMSYYEDEASENQTTVRYIVSDYVDQFANYDRGFNMSHNESEVFGHYYIRYKETISQFK